VQFEVLLNIRKAFPRNDLAECAKKAARLFCLFDTDENRLVDSYEVMIAVVMITRLATKQKMDFIHSLYDFNGTGDMSVDELTLMLRTVALGCRKIDSRLDMPGELAFS
jgi:Ca2+-binding EF-hand superfamily protein